MSDEQVLCGMCDHPVCELCGCCLSVHPDKCIKKWSLFMDPIFWILVAAGVVSIAVVVGAVYGINK